MIRFDGVSLAFARDGGESTPVLQQIDLEVERGRTLALLGPSGGGKTTALRLMNRMLSPSAGRVLVDGHDIAAVDVITLRRGMGYVVQQGALFPHLDVARNIGMLCEVRGDAPAAIAHRVDELLDLVRLPAREFRHRLPSELSGGQRQRVGVARALALDPPVLLLDEPFGALDPITRGELQRDFGGLDVLRDKTIVLVTHDLDEAFTLADRIVLLRAGRIEQQGTPEELRQQPATPWVAQFLAGARAMLLLVTVLLGVGLAAQQPARFVVGSKNFTESNVLGELMALVVEQQCGCEVVHKSGLGGTPACLAAVQAGDIDAWPEYTGTGLAVLLGENVRIVDPLQAFLRVQQDCRTKLGLEWLSPFGFDDSYALAMREEQAQALGVRTLSDLRRHGSTLRAAFSIEFHDREDGWAGLQRRYELAFQDVRTIEHNLAYQAVAGGVADVIDVYTTDAALASRPLRVLVDDLHFFPPYHAAPVVRGDYLRAHPEVGKALARLAFVLDEKTMQQLNQQAEASGGDLRSVARTFLRERGLLDAAVDGTQTNAPRWLDVGDTLRQALWHLTMAGLAVLLAMLIAVPLGIAVRKRPFAERLALGIAGVLQTVPALAMLAFFVALPGFGLSARSAIVALFLYGLLPILRNTLVGLRSIAPELLDVAIGMGLEPRQRFWRIELPLALPTLLAGVRTAMVIAIGGATLAAFVGAGGLGEAIVKGLYLHDNRLVLAGAIPAALLALLADAGLGLVERRLRPRRGGNGS